MYNESRPDLSPCNPTHLVKHDAGDLVQKVAQETDGPRVRVDLRRKLDRRWREAPPHRVVVRQTLAHAVEGSEVDWGLHPALHCWPSAVQSNRAAAAAVAAAAQWRQKQQQQR